MMPFPQSWRTVNSPSHCQGRTCDNKSIRRLVGAILFLSIPEARRTRTAAGWKGRLSIKQQQCSTTTCAMPDPICNSPDEMYVEYASFGSREGKLVLEVNARTTPPRADLELRSTRASCMRWAEPTMMPGLVASSSRKRSEHAFVSVTASCQSVFSGSVASERDRSIGVRGATYDSRASKVS